MKMPVRPGDMITFLTKDRRDASAKSVPYGAVVLQVQPGAISISDADSRNGLAQIRFHSASSQEGTYWYEYRNVGNVGISYDVLQLFDRNGVPVVCSSFIE